MRLLRNEYLKTLKEYKEFMTNMLKYHCPDKLSNGEMNIESLMLGMLRWVSNSEILMYSCSCHQELPQYLRQIVQIKRPTESLTKVIGKNQRLNMHIYKLYSLHHIIKALKISLRTGVNQEYFVLKYYKMVVSIRLFQI